ncbi:TonB-dependent receptor [uncultured Parasphingorhabdus sp.]|uniref:TonB-dependent receptor n=1 Tax=uncultured Parasphingorhabdus sp. TaxID=2709694 RepID=UPI0030D97494|tara:strand:+ start:4720 stop:7788 length:3069 start_codon:yes stop_codon:yes gene_type:complete
MNREKKVVLGGPSRTKFSAMLLASTALTLTALPALAQDQAARNDNVTEDGNAIVVSGIRATMQDSIETKRVETEIVDALSADEIGDLPALSIGEALETLTGAASHREQGGATEISIRGLGPFLGSTVINDRSAANGSGDRSVNFSMFPSELFNKVAIYKSQSASMIEGGVAGQISLDTIRPVDYGKRQIQGEFKLNYNPQNFDIAKDQRFQDFGYRGTVSYIDQFNVGDGEVGISLGYSRSESTNPEQEARVSDTANYCRNVPASTTVGVFDDNNCDTPRPDTAGTEPFVVARNSYTYRQNITDDTRDSLFAAVQIKPSPDVDINMDFQYSNRLFRENRNDLVFSEGRRIDGLGDSNALDYPLIVGENGALRQFTGETNIETNSEYAERSEKYYGGGLSIDVQATDRLKLSGDFSYSQTQRTEQSTQVRMRIQNRTDIFGVGGQYPQSRESDGTTSNNRIETAYLIGQNGSQTFNTIVRQFDVNNYDLFSDNARTRYSLSQDRYNSIFGARGDFEYEMEGFVTSVQGGVRFQELKYQSVPGGVVGTSRTEVVYSNAALSIANQACRTAFPETNFLSSVSGGNPLITNVDAAGNVISTTNSYASFDALCLAQTLEANDPKGIAFDDNGVPIYPDGNFDAIANNDVNEKSWAGYLQANFEGDLGALPIRGNLGLRAVRTKVLSNGFRGALTATPLVGGGFSLAQDDSQPLVPISASSSYTEYLPSLNLVADVRPDMQARFAVFRALSRPDPSSLGYGRTFSATNDTDATSISEIIGSASASGNPFLSPLLSWNFDAALEWYPNKDTILAGGVYYKSFNGGFEPVGQFETFEVDGQQLQALVTTEQTSSDASTIYGFELTAAHRLSYLPAPLDGLGFKLSYNYASSNFETQDGLLGAVGEVQADGSIVTSEALIPPANIFGLSKHVLSAQLYYQIGGFDLQGVYKYRSRYYQSFVGDSGSRLRYTDAAGVFEARISYKLNNNIRFTLEGLNLFGETRTDFRPTVGDLSQNLVYGPRYFAGVRAKF